MGPVQAAISWRGYARSVKSHEPSFEQKMAKAEEIIRRYGNTLRLLAG